MCLASPWHAGEGASLLLVWACIPSPAFGQVGDSLAKLGVRSPSSLMDRIYTYTYTWMCVLC